MVKFFAQTKEPFTEEVGGGHGVMITTSALLDFMKESTFLKPGLNFFMVAMEYLDRIMLFTIIG